MQYYIFKLDKYRSLHYNHSFWKLQVLETPDGTQMLSRHCTVIMASMMQMYTLMMLVLSPKLGKTIFKLLGDILHRLCENGFTIKPLKGLKPWKKNVDAILHMDWPQNDTELHIFIGCINYYWDM
ncbi:LOW QUALITY PROTEIN: hypothetical protein ACHAW6_001346 [Cyclotella cf. meneghiniana]